MFRAAMSHVLMSRLSRTRQIEYSILRKRAGRKATRAAATRRVKIEEILCAPNGVKFSVHRSGRVGNAGRARLQFSRSRSLNRIQNVFDDVRVFGRNVASQRE